MRTMSPRFVKKKPKASDEQGRKGGRKRAGNVAEPISYKALFRDGVAMNDFGTYSRTYRFGDISYQSASDEAQAAICKRMRMLYNGLTPDVRMQMTLVNRPIHDSEIGNRTFFEVRDDATGPLAAEYNDILNAKMLEGCRTWCASATSPSRWRPRTPSAPSPCSRACARWRRAC